jgi:hypothetical protein
MNSGMVVRPWPVSCSSKTPNIVRMPEMMISGPPTSPKYVSGRGMSPERYIR